MTTKADETETAHVEDQAGAPAVDPNDDPLTRIEMNDPHLSGSQAVAKALAE